MSPKPGKPRWRVHWLAWPAMLAALLGWLVFSFLDLRNAPGDDLSSIAIAGRLVAQGQSSHLYDHDPVRFHVVESAPFRRAAAEIGFTGFAHPFVHPPLVALLAMPLSSLRFEAVRVAWCFLSVLALAAGVALAFRIYQPSWNRPAPWALVFALLPFFEPARYGLWLAQTTPIVFFLVMASIALTRRGRPVAAGLLLAIPAFVKLSPAILALVWAWRGPRRAALGLAAGLAALWGASLALGDWQLHATFFERMGEIGSGTIVAFNNHSLVAFLARPDFPAIEATTWNLLEPTAFARAASVALLLAIAAGAVFWLRRARRPSDGMPHPLAEGIAMVLMVLAPSLAWTHYFVFLIPTVAIAASACPPPRRWPVSALLGAALALCMRPVIFDHVEWDAFHLLVPGPTIATLAAGLLLLWLSRRAASDAAAAPSW